MKSKTQAGRSRRFLLRSIQIVVLLSLLISIALNVATFQELKRQYREMKTVRLDPLGVREAAFPPESPAGASADTPLVLFFGDSRAQAWPAPRIAGWRFVNRGVDGQTTEQALGRYSDQVLSLRPKAIVLECGVNDLTAIGVLPEKRDQIITQCKANLHRMIAIARQQNATVIVATILPAGTVSLARRPFWSGQIDAAVRAVNDDLRNIHEPSVLILDADTILLKQGEVRRELYRDTLHVKPTAYDGLNTLLKKSLASPPSSIDG